MLIMAARHWSSICIYVAKRISLTFKFEDRLGSENVLFFYGVLLILKLHVSMLKKVACHWLSSAFMLQEEYQEYSKFMINFHIHNI